MNTYLPIEIIHNISIYCICTSTCYCFSKYIATLYIAVEKAINLIMSQSTVWVSAVEKVVS